MAIPVILGASEEKQLLQNLSALTIKEKLTDDIMRDIDKIIKAYQEK